MNEDLMWCSGQRVRHRYKNISGLYEGDCELTEREGYDPYYIIKLSDMNIGGEGWLAIQSPKDIELEEYTLKDCPFCGDVGRLVDEAEYNYRVNSGQLFSVGCHNEHCLMFVTDQPLTGSKEECIRLWNRRV